jgi:tetratricopeptide (TPR) repeat protein
MAEISLRKYCDEVRGLVEAKRVDQAIAICRHILQHHPHYLEAYRVLGQVCLQGRDLEEAKRQFQRVLSADPEDFTARVGLAKANEGRGDIGEAIWQMERALELSPGNAEVRQELQRLYGQRDGVTPTRLQLTRGALGRLYAQGQLFPQAIQEFQSVLAEDPDRVDIQVALAETYWRSGQKLPAVEACQSILEKLPECLKANLILGYVWHQGGHGDEAEKRLQVARALDPENAVAQKLFGADPLFSPQEVKISRLEEAPTVSPRLAAPAEESAEPSTLDWLRQLEEEETAITVAGPQGEAEIPDWLQGVGGDVLAAIPTEALAEGAAEEPEVELPDWFAGAKAEDAEGLASWEQILSAAIPEPGAPLEEFAPGEEVAQPESAVPAEDFPDWLQQLRPPAEPEPATIAEVDFEEEEEETAISDWAQEPELPAPGPAAKATEQAISGEAARAAEVPEWLEGALEEPPLPQEALPAIDREVPDWLRGWEQGEAPAGEVSPLAEPGLPAGVGDAEGLPDWLRQLRGVPSTAEELEEIIEEEYETALAGEVPEQVEAQPVEEEKEVPEWLRKLREGIIETPAATTEPEATLAEEELELEAAPDVEAPPAFPEMEAVAPAPAAEIDERAEGQALWEQILAEEGLDLEAIPDVEAPPAFPEMEAAAPPPVEPVEEEGAGGPLWRQLFAEAGAAPATPEPEAAPTPPEAVTPLPAPEAEAGEDVLWEQILAEEGIEIEAAPEAAVPSRVTPVAEEGLDWLEELARIEKEEEQEVAEPPPPVAKVEPEEKPVVKAPPVEKPTPVVAKPQPEKPAPKPPTPAAPPAEELPDVARRLAKMLRPEEEEAPVAREKPAPPTPPTRVPANKHEAKLFEAQEAAGRGELPIAMKHYEKLVQSGQLVDAVIEDLEELARTHPDDHTVYQLLGDAYMKDGRLQRALETYQLALTKV